MKETTFLHLPTLLKTSQERLVRDEYPSGIITGNGLLVSSIQWNLKESSIIQINITLGRITIVNHFPTGFCLGILYYRNVHHAGL